MELQWNCRGMVGLPPKLLHTISTIPDFDYPKRSAFVYRVPLPRLSAPLLSSTTRLVTFRQAATVDRCVVE